MPVWNTNAEETPYMELGEGDALTIPEKAIEQEDDHMAIGDWGERLVNNYLHKRLDDAETNVVAVNWVNEEKESGLPYDFEIDLYDPETQTITKVYVEVKSTMSSKKSFFEISANEVKFAQKTQENYHLYRVFNAGDQNTVRLSKLENLASLMDKKLVKMCMVV